MNKPTTEKVRFCPQCQSATVDASALAGGNATCRGCGWVGKQEDLLVRELNHEFASQTEVLQFFAKEIALLVASQAQGLGRILLKWGFITLPLDGPTLSRYVLAAARGVAKEILAERERIELEAAKIEQGGPVNDA